MADLATEYMGLAPPTPSCSPAPRSESHRAQPRDRRGARRRRRRAPPLRGADRGRRAPRSRRSCRAAPSRTRRRGPTSPQRVGPHEYLSLVERARRRSRSRSSRASTARAGELDRSTPATSSRRGADAARGEPVRRRGGPGSLLGGGRGALPRRRRARSGRRSDPDRGEALALLHLARPLRGDARRPRRERPRPLQPLPPARHLARAMSAPRR